MENKTNFSSNNHRAHRTEISNQADHVYKEAKKLGSQVYDEGRGQFDVLQDNIKEHSGKIAKKVHQNPLSSLVIAAGIGFVLARIFRH